MNKTPAISSLYNASGARVLPLIWLLCALACVVAPAQDIPSRNSYSGYLELGGPAGIGSINAERQIVSPYNWKLNGKIGFFIQPNGSLTRVANSYFLPFGLHLLWGRTHQLEVGAGSMLTINNDGFLEGAEAASDLGLYGQGFLGYRRAIGDGSWFLRAGYVPLYHPDMDAASAQDFGAVTGNWAHWGSIDIGTHF